jgi:CHAT domain-containing protein/Tfp pilus assembly protein PilF
LQTQTGNGGRSALMANSTRLELSKTIERQLAGGESHEYWIVLDAGRYVKVAVQQQSIDLAVAVFAPHGTELINSDSFAIGHTETAELITTGSGAFRLRLAASDPHAPYGRYAITLEDVTSATDRRRNRVSASREFARGMTLRKQGTRGARLEAIHHLGLSVVHWRTAQDRVAEAETLDSIASVHIELGNEQKAFEYATEALSVTRQSHASVAESRALDSLGEVHNYFGDKRKAITCYEEALSLARAEGERAEEGKILSNLGVAYSGLGEKRRALDQFDEAVRIFRELQDRRMMGEVLGNMGVTYDNLGEYQRALDNHQTELVLQRELGDRVSEAVALNNVGSAYSGLGAYQRALDAYTAALKINRSLDDRWNAAINLNNIAWVYDQLAEHRRALTFYQESLEIFHALPDRRRTAVTLNNIAEIYAELGDYRKAAALHNQALPLRRLVGDADGEANSLNNLGKAYAKLGQPDKARALFEQALAKHRVSGNRYMMARTLRNLGELDRATGHAEQARQYLDEALETSRTIRDRSGEASAFADLADLERDCGNLSAAHQRAQEALSAFESLRLGVLSPQLRATLFASIRKTHELNLEILAVLEARQPGEGFAAAGLLASERGRARSLLEMLGESGTEIRRGVDAGLLDRERKLEKLIAGKAEQQTRLLGGKHTNSEAAAAEKELDALTGELDQVQSRIRETSPQYAALTQPAPLNLREIQTKVLDEETVLLEYALGSERSFLWLVSASSIDLFELPPRAEIESATKRVYELLTVRNRKLPQESPAARAVRVRQADHAYVAAGAKVSRMLLGPVASRIENKRLLIVGEGMLQYLPFGALPEPGPNGQSPLIVNHEVVTSPSASVVAALRQEIASRKPAEKAVAILADPVFSADDPRVTQRTRPLVGSGAEDTPNHPPRSTGDLGIQEFVRLRFTRNEAETIARLAPPPATLQALDFDASRETALRPDLAQYRIVHFATHSLLNNDRPELSGVVLSLVDRRGRPQNGFLRLYDIYNLRLGAELVVLSACESALGEEIKGEGLIGLTRGFLYSGAPRVLATLWNIDDRTTAEMMRRFYEGLLARGERPAAALRAAQVTMWRSKAWDTPYYWGAFTLQGEWR